jgi:hypothetical protein
VGQEQLAKAFDLLMRRANEGIVHREKEKMRQYSSERGLHGGKEHHLFGQLLTADILHK